MSEFQGIQIVYRVGMDSINFELLNLRIFEMTNTVRQMHLLKPLKYSRELSLLSSLHSTQMKKYDFFSHTNSHNPLLKELGDRTAYLNLNYEKVTENIADMPYLNSNGETRIEIRIVNGQTRFFSEKDGRSFNYYTVDSFSEYVVDAWMNSKGHRKNILDQSVTHLGCGAVIYLKALDVERFSMPYLKVTQNFAKL